MVDLDVTKNFISAPGCMSAALIDEVIEGHTDNLTQKSINYFHGEHTKQNFQITPDFFD